jgi:hypothetical protein
MSAVSSPTSEETFRRGSPRHPLSVPIDLIALRFGVPETLPGRCTDISEGGVGVVVAGELSPGQQVAIELRLPNVVVPFRARAFVRYQFRLRCGLELVSLSADELHMIRYWLYRSLPADADEKPESSREDDTDRRDRVKAEDVDGAPDQVAFPSAANNSAHGKAKAKSKIRVRLGRRGWYVLGALLLAAAASGWWRWQKSWSELEGHSPQAHERLHVSAETMGTRLVSKVEPVYPATAREQGTQGIVVLDAIIAEDGSVKKLRPISGPDVLVQSTTEAVGAWKFAPYFSSGRPVEVETTIAVEFRLD